jgi:flagella basal body P-ring formation protein FlgA
MKYLFYSSLIFLFYTHHAFSACNLVTYPQIIKINKQLDGVIIKSSDCSEEIQNEFIEFVSSMTGNISADHLQKIFLSEHSTQVNFLPANIQVESMESTLTRLLSLDKDTVLSNITSFYSQSCITLENEVKLSASCSDCDQAGIKNFKLNRKNTIIWLTGEIQIRRKGFIVIDEINPFNENLNENLFQSQAFLDDGKDHLFQDLQNIRFYKTNKRLEKGRVLKMTDLSPINLIRPGQKINMILNGKNISLKSSAYSRSQGKFGDYIEVYNTKSNKKITAQVVDFNTVMVQL